jgi:NAD(P)-dependent dehydrogenase (short-subunit alcohol dehydrogenase family)
MTTGKVVLVTGASQGIGKAIATSFLNHGYKVFGASRKPNVDLNGVTLIELDIRSAASVAVCVQTVEREAGAIDVLVNNAGLALVGTAEETDLGRAHDMFETNFWGTVSMTRAALAGMRRRRRGRIINVSSIAGYAAFPFGAYYAASKHAINGFSEALRYEVMRFGVYVSVIAPGEFRTPMTENVTTPELRIDDYQSMHEQRATATSGGVDSLPSPEPVGALAVSIAQEKRPKLYYTVGPGARSLRLGKQILPQGVYERQMMRMMGIPRQR